MDIVKNTITMNNWTLRLHSLLVVYLNKESENDGTTS